MIRATKTPAVAFTPNPFTDRKLRALSQVTNMLSNQGRHVLQEHERVTNRVAHKHVSAAPTIARDRSLSESLHGRCCHRSADVSIESITIVTGLEAYVGDIIMCGEGDNDNDADWQLVHLGGPPYEETNRPTGSPVLTYIFRNKEPNPKAKSKPRCGSSYFPLTSSMEYPARRVSSCDFGTAWESGRGLGVRRP